MGKRAWEKGCLKTCGILDIEADRGLTAHAPVRQALRSREDIKARGNEVVEESGR